MTPLQLAGLIAAILLHLVGGNPARAAQPCDTGIVLYSAMPTESAKSQALYDSKKQPYSASLEPLATITSDMVRVAQVKELKMYTGQEGVPARPIYSVRIELKPWAIESVSSSLAGHVPASVLLTCRNEVLASVPLNASIPSVLLLGSVNFTLDEAREIASVFSQNIELLARESPVITERGVGDVLLGDSLGDISRKLDNCTLLILHSSPEQSEGVLVRGDCGPRLQLEIEMDAEGRVRGINVEGGEAKTAGGVGVGSDVDQVLRSSAGEPHIESGGSMVCFRLPASGNSIAFCLNSDDAERYRRAVAAGKVAKLGGRVGSIRVGR
jgi:hypothetical protein